MIKLQNTIVVGLLLAVSLNSNPLSAQSDHADHSGPAMNYRAINDDLATGGHFVGDGLETIAAQGVQVVIDLRDDPPAGQSEKLAEQGIKWINIPVEWRDPKRSDFEAFSAAMNEHQGEKILVQCQANYRASAMTYLYRVQVQNVPESGAQVDLHAVWEPNEQWTDYMNSITN